MPRITLRQQVEELAAECKQRSKTIARQAQKMADINAKYNGQLQSNADLKRNNERLVKQAAEAIDERETAMKATREAREDLRNAENYSHDLHGELHEVQRCQGFQESQRSSMLTLLYNGFTLLYPYLVGRGSTENTDILEPNDRLLLQLVDHLNQPYPPPEPEDYVRSVQRARRG